MRVLVTGVTGFIGYSLAERLAERGYTVYGLVRFAAQNRKLPENVIPIVGDLSDYYAMVRVVEATRPNVVFHLGALTPVSESFHQPVTYAEINYIGTVNLLEALRRHAFEQLRLFALAGTTEMYDTLEPIDDSQVFSPKSPYAVSKVAATYYSEYMWHTYKLPTVVVVPSNSYGRAYVGQRHFFIEKVITSMLLGAKEIKLGNPDTIRDWMFREDHVNAYLKVMEAALNEKEVFGQRFYFGTGKGYTTRETFERIRKLIGWDGEVIWNVYLRPNDSKKIVVNPEKAMRVLGWRARYDLESGLRKAIEEWRHALGLS